MLMSAEKIINTDREILTSLKIDEVSTRKTPDRVDINELLARVRKKKEKESRMNVVFTGITVSLIGVVGIILSF
jgi:preprotein translocase subunit Sss1